jgi:hypothetical protein
MISSLAYLLTDGVVHDSAKYICRSIILKDWSDVCPTGSSCIEGKIVCLDVRV